MTQLVCLLLTLLFSLSSPALEGNVGFRQSSLAAKTGANSFDDLLRAAQKEFPNKAGRIEQHHITPKYLGGDPKGPRAPLDAAYHQKITTEFRNQWSYGQGRVPSQAELQRIMDDVYRKYPLPSGN